MKKAMRLLVSGVALSLLPLTFGAGEASAWGGKGYECTTLSNGDLCIRIYHSSDGYTNTRKIEVDYSKFSGSTIYVKGGFSSPGGTVWAGSYSSLSSGHTYRKYFDNVPFDRTVNVTGLIQVQGQGQFATPPQSISEYYG
ncbi:hypothetical protein [Streptomyces olivochromogenes]|uniref:hypothetical protein n=1 Tax=Streptomyces olivochromogenes TaxID=1963 RepID=UPI001F1B2232|nr:hypothetical protein [Streptomyces olivochromogenes]MCF3136347.1 hypothetical protein [Streptomyces olivochromogenes]